MKTPGPRSHRRTSFLTIIMSIMRVAERSPRSGSFRFRNRLQIGVGLILLLLAALGIITFRAVLDQIETRDEVKNTYELLIGINGVLAAVVDAETGERGFLLTGNDAFLEPYYDATANVRRLLRDLQDQAAGNEDRAIRTRQLSEAAGIALGFLARVLDVYREDGPEAARRLVATGEGKEYMDRVRRIGRTILSEKRTRLEARQLAEERAERRTLLAITLSLTVIIALLGWLVWLVHRETRRRESVESAMLVANSRLQESLQETRRLERERQLQHRLVEMLQGCQDRAEACAVIGRTLLDLLPHRAGAVSLFNASRNLVETAHRWGESEVGEAIFEPDHCWALRRGRVHAAGHREITPRCRHLHAQRFDNSLCQPLMAHGDTLGVLILADTEQAVTKLAAGELLSSVSEQISLALANLQLHETLRYQSLRDPLTGLFNRRYLETTLDRELSRAERRRGSLSVIMGDLDHFKRLNDTYGHDAGDRVLQEFAELLRTFTRSEDVACRYGGEEFLLILPDTPAEVCLRRATELCAAVRELMPAAHGEEKIRVTGSFGVASFPQHGRTRQELIARADAALYRAKRNGRDQVEMAIDDDRAASERVR